MGIRGKAENPSSRKGSSLNNRSEIALHAALTSCSKDSKACSNVLAAKDGQVFSYTGVGARRSISSRESCPPQCNNRQDIVKGEAGAGPHLTKRGFASWCRHLSRLA